MNGNRILRNFSFPFFFFLFFLLLPRGGGGGGGGGVRVKRVNTKPRTTRAVDSIKILLDAPNRPI